MDAMANLTSAVKAAVLLGWSNPFNFASPTTAGASCCSLLEDAGLASRLLYPDSGAYKDRTESYWSVSAQLKPSCIVQPLDTAEVSLVVTTLVADESCLFAVRSGGHAIWAGASNVENGVTIDLGNMNATTYHAENGTAGIQPGASWLQVYRTLDAHGLTVPGGRAGTVGVGGLVTGGGNSFFSARTGMVCDAVVNYEVVLASGAVVHANAGAHSDLFRALKGGSSNFGIVTRFDMEAFAAPRLWGGTVLYNKTHSPALLDAIVHFTDAIEQDPFSSSIVFWTYQPALRETVIAAAYETTDGRVAPPIFDRYMAVESNITSTMRLTNMSDLTHELEQPAGYRAVWFTLTFKNDERVLAKAVELHEKLVADFGAISADGDFITQCMFQPLPAVFARHSVARGGNVLGLDRVEDNGILWLATLAVHTAADEAAGRAMMDAWGAAVREYAASIGAARDFVYLNYADKTQKPLESYGAENIRKIRAAAAKYDPSGVFQHRVPGGFKISHVAPITEI